MHSRLWPCEGEKKGQVVNSKGREGTRSFRDLKAVPKSVQNEVTQGSQGEGRRVCWPRRGEGRQTGQPARPRSPDLPAGREQWEEARAGGAASGDRARLAPCFTWAASDEETASTGAPAPCGSTVGLSFTDPSFAISATYA